MIRVIPLFVVLSLFVRLQALSLRMISGPLNIGEVSKLHVDGDRFYRLFHPAFPLEINASYSIEDSESFNKLKLSINSDIDLRDALDGLPWEMVRKKE